MFLNKTPRSKCVRGEAAAGLEARVEGSGLSVVVANYPGTVQTARGPSLWNGTEENGVS